MGLADLIRSHRQSTLRFEKPYIIAEAGVNHEGSLDIAKRLIDEALEGGANAIKFQSYKAETLASKNSPAYWDTSLEETSSQFELFKKYDSFWKNEYEELAVHCEKSGIEFLSTPFDLESAIYLNDLMDVIKISSSDINNKPFISFLSGLGKPLIVSTGASHLWEVSQFLSWIDTSSVPVALLHCILNYPTADENANLGMIVGLRESFPQHMIGYSDHTLPGDMRILEAATLLGARIIEKHFTHDKSLPGNDHYHAMDKNDLVIFRKRLERLALVIGSHQRHPIASEEIARANARRSLVASRFIPKGKKIELEDLTWKRPGTGIPARDIDRVVGLHASYEIKDDSLISWELVQGE